MAAPTETAASKRPRVTSSTSPDKRDSLIQDLPGNKCFHCKKACTSKSEAIQCDLCAVWVHARCEGVSSDLYKSLNHVSTSIPNLSYYCKANHCDSRSKQLIQMDSSSQPEQPISTLPQDLELLATAHNTLEKAVSDLSSKITNLQAQESKLSDQIKTTSDVLGKHTTNPPQYVSDRKSNVVLYGIDESPPKTPKHERLQKDIKTTLEIFSSIEVQIDPAHVVDCFRLGKFKQNQSRPRPILIKLQRAMDVSAILANKKSLSSPFTIKPDMSSEERSIESLLLKERWSLLQSGHHRKQIKLSGNQIFINGHLHGEVINSAFKHYSSTPNQPMDQSHSQPQHQEQSS